MKLPLALAVCALLLAGCNPQPQHAPAQSPTAAPTSTGLPPLKITGRGSAHHPVRVVGQQRGGRKTYELIAQSYESHSLANTTEATFHQTQVTFYDKDGTTLHAQAPLARVDDRRKQVILTGGVHATTSSGLTLVCDELVYDDKSALLHGSGNVQITGTQGGQQQVLTGNTFTSDVKLTRMTMR
jgi:LPS export ABC transporter protein LptC